MGTPDKRPACPDNSPYQSESVSDRIALIDIGSNSMRLVMYRDYGRYPFPLFNERVTVKLGQGLDETGRLAEERVKVALQAIRRFAQILTPLQPDQIVIIATAALRRAENAAAFIQPAEQILGHKIQVVPAEEEARLVTLGLTANLPAIDGLVADLGGGSLELVLVSSGQVKKAVSLNIGHLSTRTKTEIRDIVAQVDWLAEAEGKTLYGVGGSFRALGSAFVTTTAYPLHLLHGLIIRPKHRKALLKRIRTGDDLSGIPAGRRATIGTAAIILTELFRKAKSGPLMISGTSIRDGMIADMTQNRLSDDDPLTLTCLEIARQTQRSPELNESLNKMLVPVASHFAADKNQKALFGDLFRLTKAACLLSDISWNEPSDLRGQMAYDKVIALPVYGLTHKERAWIGKAIFHRYVGVKKNKPSMVATDKLLSKAERASARAVGLGMRFGHIFCGGHAPFLNQLVLTVKDNTLYCRTGQQGRSLMDEHSARRLQLFAEACGLRLDLDNGPDRRKSERQTG